MKLKTKWEQEAITNLRKLDTLQRARLLGDIKRTLAASEITQRVSGLKKVGLAPPYKTIQAYGEPPGVSLEFDRHGA